MTEANQIESIGARLHKARLRKKVTVEQVYKDIRIHPRIITALEEDRYEDFLSPIYSKAFLKSYCRYLEVDANKLLSDYDRTQKEAGKSDPDQRKQQKSDTFSRINWNEYLKLGKKWALPVLGGVIAVFLSLYLISLAGKVVKKITNLGASKRQTITAAKTKESSMIKTVSIPQGQPLNLIVKTKGDVWLEIRSDDKTIFKSTLKKGSVETYRAEQKFQLWTGKGEFLELVLNGNPLGSPGNGVIKNIVLTREGLKIEKK
jgi:cytoskeleton protein RodZ